VTLTFGAVPEPTSLAILAGVIPLLARRRIAAEKSSLVVTVENCF
jgi:hypothetical protein